MELAHVDDVIDPEAAVSEALKSHETPEIVDLRVLVVTAWTDTITEGRYGDQ